MSEDFDMWNIEQTLESYSDVPDMQERVKIKLENLFFFLERNLLLTCVISDGSGRLVKKCIKKSELTSEGIDLAFGPNNPVHRWLGSKGGQKNPPDMRMLEKALAEIRAKK